MIFIGARFAVIHPILALASFNSQRRLDVRARHAAVVGLLRLQRRLLAGYSLFSALAQQYSILVFDPVCGTTRKIGDFNDHGAKWKLPLCHHRLCQSTAYTSQPFTTHPYAKTHTKRKALHCRAFRLGCDGLELCHFLGACKVTLFTWLLIINL